MSEGLVTKVLFGAVDFIGEHFTALIFGIMLALCTREMYSWSRGRRLALTNQCARCGAANASIPLPSEGGLLCIGCGSVALRQDRLGLLLMRGFIGLSVCGLAFATAQSMSAGKGIPWDLVGIVVMWGIIGPLFLIQRFRMPRDRNE